MSIFLPYEMPKKTWKVICKYSTLLSEYKNDPDVIPQNILKNIVTLSQMKNCNMIPLYIGCYLIKAHSVDHPNLNTEEVLKMYYHAETVLSGLIKAQGPFDMHDTNT